MEADRGKSWLAGVFDRAAPTYDRVGESYHEVFGRRLVERVGSITGASVLDVACGKGAVAFPAATAAGPTGRVVGIDISSEMVRLCVEELKVRGLPHSRALVMDAEDLAFNDDRFDAVFCAFGVFFLPQPGKAAAEVARVLKPGGTFGISTWGEGDPRWEWEDDLIGGLDVDRRSIAQPFDTSESLQELLAGAGLEDVEVSTDELDVVLADEDEWWAWKWSYSLRGLLEQLDGEALDRFRRTAVVRMAQQKTEEGYPIRLTALLAYGTAPAAP